MNRNQANEFAANWINAWNRKDVNAVLEHYVDDAKFISPKAATFVGSPFVKVRKRCRNIGYLRQKRSKKSNSL